MDKMSRVIYHNVLNTEIQVMDRKRVEMMAEIYKNGDDFRTQSSQSTGHESMKIKRYRSVTVCLVLLCVLLLTAVIVLCVLINTNNQQFDIKTKNITEERDQLLTKYTNIKQERDQLLTNNTNFKKERDQLRTNNTNLKKDRDQLLTDSSNLKKEREQLLLNSKNLATENKRLSTNNCNLNKQRDQLTQQKNTMMEILKADGWKEYQSSLYFISSEKKSWSDSRRYCRRRGADLISINNHEERDFIEKISVENKHWIGLSDIDVEGRWKWVDGSTPSYGFWHAGEPNSGRTENCALKHWSLWADYPCNEAYNYFCEKNNFK
nr:CD209 antigen-like protein C isoform X1 [Misgurnus anguillicaudatus]